MTDNTIQHNTTTAQVTKDTQKGINIVVLTERSWCQTGGVSQLTDIVNKLDAGNRTTKARTYKYSSETLLDVSDLFS